MSSPRLPYTTQPAPNARRRSYHPQPAPAVTPAVWPPLSVSYPPPTPMAPRVHTVPLPEETPRYSLRALPSPVSRYSPPRSAPAVMPMSAQSWPAPGVLPFASGRAAPVSAPIPIPGMRPRSLTIARSGPQQRSQSGPPSAASPRFPASANYSPMSIPMDVDTDNSLLIPSSPTTQAAIRRSHTAISLALNSPHPIMVSGHTYTTAEHLLEAMKFKYHPEIVEQIRCSGDPRRTAEMYGHYVRIDWESRKAVKIEEVVRAKYLQNPDLIVELLDTGNRYLIDEADTQFNHLGGALMRLRREYLSGERDSLG